MAVDPKQRRAARHAQTPVTPVPDAHPRAPITVERIIDAALAIVAAEGFDALTMRRVAGALNTGPASLYAHVVNKADLDELLIGRLCAQLVLPEPDPDNWREQIQDVCAQIRDRYLAYPGLSRAGLAMVPTNLDVLTVSERMFAILIAGGISPQTAGWALDALMLYINAYTLEISLVTLGPRPDDAEWVLSQEELVARFSALPRDRFPHITRYATELTSGSGHDRFDFTLGLMLDNLSPTAGPPPTRS